MTLRIFQRPFLPALHVLPRISTPLHQRIQAVSSRQFATFPVNGSFPPIVSNISKWDVGSFVYSTAKGLVFCFPRQDVVFDYLKIHVKDTDQHLIDLAVKEFSELKLSSSEIQKKASELISKRFPTKDHRLKEEESQELAEVLRNCVKYNASCGTDSQFDY